MILELGLVRWVERLKFSSNFKFWHKDKFQILFLKFKIHIRSKGEKERRLA